MKSVLNSVLFLLKIFVFLAPTLSFHSAKAQLSASVVGGVYPVGCQLIKTDKSDMYVSGYFQQFFITESELYSEREGKYFLARYNQKQEIVWLKQFEHRIKDFLVTESQVVVLLQFQKSIRLEQDTIYSKGDFNTLLLFLDKEGNIQRKKHVWSTKQAFAAALSKDLESNILIVGSFEGTLHLDSLKLNQKLKKNIYLAKLNPEGKVQWLKQGTSGVDIMTGIYVRGIDVDNYGNTYLTGSLTGMAYFDNKTLRSTREYFVGEGVVYNSDIFMAKYDAQGQIKWLKNIAQKAEVGDIACDSSGCAYLTGYFKGAENYHDRSRLGMAYFDQKGLKVSFDKQGKLTEDMFIAKYSPLGNLIWVKRAKGKNINRGISLSIDRAKDLVYVSGFFREEMYLESQKIYIEDKNSSKGDIFLACYTAKGAFEWLKQAGGAETDNISDSTLDYNGNLYLTGHFKQNITFGSLSLHVLNLESSGFIVKY